MEKCEIKYDCFAYEKGRCTALRQLCCDRQNCSFYKTKEQEMADRKKYNMPKYKYFGDIEENE